MEHETFNPVGRCIYCDAQRYSEARKRFGDEHIIPEGPGGRLILPEASCQRHERITNQSEQFCQRNTMIAFRCKLGIKLKRCKDKRAKALPADFLIDHSWQLRNVPLADYPVTMLIPTLQIPDLMRAAPIEKSRVLQYSKVDLWDVTLRWTPKTRQLVKVEPCP
jgi:hypothetical protein